MRPIHVYQAINDNITASSKYCLLFPKIIQPPIRLRHTLKDLNAMAYWYTVETVNYWFDIDIRQFLEITPHLQMMWAMRLTVIKSILRDAFIARNVGTEDVELYLLKKATNNPDCIFYDKKYQGCAS